MPFNEKLRPVYAAALAVVLLSACSSDPHSQEITPEFLEDQKAMTSISNRLEPEDRELFGRYIVNRTIGNQIIPGGAILKADGSDPKTVGEAIALMRAFRANQDEWQRLETEREAKLKVIMDKRDKLHERPGWATDNPTINEINALSDQYNAIVEEYRAKIDEVQKRPLTIK